MVSSLPRATSASDDRALNTLFEGEATQQGKSLALMKLEELDKLLDQLVTNITTISDTISERAVMLGKAGLSDNLMVKDKIWKTIHTTPKKNSVLWML